MDKAQEFNSLTNGQIAVLLEAVRRTIEQGKPANCEILRDCAYRNEEGLCCAVGSLIEDAFYTPNLEGKDINAEVLKDAVFLSFPGVDLDSVLFIDTLSLIQKAHDRASPNISHFRYAFVSRLNSIFPPEIMKIIDGYVELYDSKEQLQSGA